MSAEQGERCQLCGSLVEIVFSDEGTSCYRPASAEQGDARPEGREGMVTVYDSDDRYLGCMGRETWDRMLGRLPRDRDLDARVDSGSVGNPLSGGRYVTDGQRLGAALMEANEVRIKDATFACTVSAGGLKEMGEKAWKVCHAYFGDNEFVITDLDADAVQNGALGTIGYTARVHARAR